MLKYTSCFWSNISKVVDSYIDEYHSLVFFLRGIVYAKLHSLFFYQTSYLTNQILLI